MFYYYSIRAIFAFSRIRNNYYTIITLQK